MRKLKDSSRFVVCLIEGIVFELILYVFGVAWFMTVYTRNTGAIGLMTVLSMCVFPFLIPDAIKLVIACTTSLRTVRIVKQK